jgi:hypothetical protein
LGQFRRGHDGREEEWNVYSNMKNAEVMLKTFEARLVAVVVLIDLWKLIEVVGVGGGRLVSCRSFSQPPPWHNATGRRKAV